MRTKQPRKADAIFTADWHLRADVPVCRTDDYQHAMFRKVEFITSLSRQHGCPIFIAGDIGHKPRWPHWLEARCIQLFKDRIILAVSGQHDLPNHQLDRFEDSGAGVLSIAKALDLLTLPHNVRGLPNDKGCINVLGFPYGVLVEWSEDIVKCIRRIALAHMMVIDKNKLWPGQVAPQARALLRKHKCFDVIVTGDNHNPFVAEYEGRLLVNPGSMMRMTAAQVDHKPRVYLWYAEDNTVEPVYLPIEKGVVDRGHIEVKEQREERMTAFVERLKDDYEVGFSFVKNLEEFFRTNKVRPLVKEKVMEAME